mgnify:CR=1 FL=1
MQLSRQQFAAALKNFEERLKSKQLEVDALNRLRVASGIISRLLPDTPVGPQDCESIRQAVDDFLTAKINMLLVDVQEFELNIRAMKAQQSGLLIATPGAPGSGPVLR